VLVVGVGQGARLLGMLTLDEKAYEGRIVFGSETTTDDAEGEVTVTAPVPDRLRDERFARDAVVALVGEHDQVPPAFSAISVNGKRAYDRARQGETVVLEPRHVRIHEARLLSLENGEVCAWNIYVRVTKGTYVRSIARDVGRELGSAAHLDGLRRVSSGVVTIDDCLTLDELDALREQAIPARCLDPVRALGYAFRVLSDQEFADVSNGRRVEPGLCVDIEGSIREPRQDELVSLVHGGALVGVWRRVGGTLRCEANFPVGIVGVGGMHGR
jgi:tRNA pseudouridine55 synthase